MSILRRLQKIFIDEHKLPVQILTRCPKTLRKQSSSFCSCSLLSLECSSGQITSGRTERRAFFDSRLREQRFPLMSLSDERGNKTIRTERARAFARGAVSPLHHRLAHFRHRHLDAGDGASLGHEYADRQSDSSWDGGR